MKQLLKYCQLILICFFTLSTISTISFGCKKTPTNKENSSKDSTSANPVELPANFAKGADVSWLTEMEADGRKFYDTAGVQQDCFEILKSKGINSIRLRAWVNPLDGWNNTVDVIAKAVRAKKLGMRVMIDFHYSDTWADPGHQAKPASWANLDLADLKAAVYNYTFDVLDSLKANGVTPEWVETGNEINNGLLWPTGEITVGGAVNYAQLINSAYDAVKAVDSSIKTILHISNGYDNGLFRWNLDNLKNNGGKWDITGMSCYPSVSGWADYDDSAFENMQDMVSRYGKPVVISEVGMDVNSAQATKDMLIDLMTKNASLGENGIGVFYWEPEAYNWQGYSLVAFDNSGKPTIALDAFELK